MAEMSCWYVYIKDFNLFSNANAYFQGWTTLGDTEMDRNTELEWLELTFDRKC